MHSGLEHEWFLDTVLLGLQTQRLRSLGVRLHTGKKPIPYEASAPFGGFGLGTDQNWAKRPPLLEHFVLPNVWRG